jgi:hypothetical protein
MRGEEGGREGGGGVLGFLGSLYMRTGIGPRAGYIHNSIYCISSYGALLVTFFETVIENPSWINRFLVVIRCEFGCF